MPEDTAWPICATKFVNAGYELNYDEELTEIGCSQNCVSGFVFKELNGIDRCFCETLETSRLTKTEYFSGLWSDWTCEFDFDPSKNRSNTASFSTRRQVTDEFVFY